MKDIITIIVRLTVSCILAGVVMGAAFVVTNKAKKHNEHINEQKVTYALLGYSQDSPPPESMALSDIYRYVVTENGVQSIGYLIPGKDHHYSFLRIDLDGKFVDSVKVEIEEEKVREEGDRNLAIQNAIGAGKLIKYAEKTVVATNNGERVAYLIEGKFQGFKTFISVMLAVDPEFTLLGLEIMEHEEDPGLGGEIEQDYFKNQFKNKPFEVLKKVKVVKEPIPTEVLQALEGKMEDPKRSEVLLANRDNDIYALTGATISTKAVNDGVRGIVKKFAYRFGVLDKVLAEQQLATPF